MPHPHHHDHNHHLGCACCGHLPKLANSDAATQAMLGEIEQVLRKTFPQQSQRAVIFHGGVIHTMEAPASRRVEALGIADGVIVAAGTLEEVRARMDHARHHAAEHHLHGHTLLPGLIDPHVHVLGSALNKSWNNVSPFRNGADADSETSQTLNPDYALPLLKQWIETALNDPDRKNLLLDSNGKTIWFVGYGVDPSLMSPWGDINEAWFKELHNGKIDGRDLAILLINASGHLAYANQAAIDKIMSDPEAAEKMGDVTTSKGVLTELQVTTAMGVVSTYTPTQDHLPQGIAQVLQNAAQRGITTLFDPSMGVNDTRNTAANQELSALQLTAQLGPLRLAGSLFASQSQNLDSWLSDQSHWPLELDNPPASRFSVKGIKMIYDGSNQGLTGYQQEEYACFANPPAHADNPVPRVPKVPPTGMSNYEGHTGSEAFPALLKRALDQGWPTLIHANGDRAMSDVLDSYRQALSAPDGVIDTAEAKRLRPRVEHASLMDDAALESMAELELNPSFLIGHVGYWGYAFQQTIFGESKADMLDRCKSALDKGMRVSLHSDHFVSPLGPLRMAEQAIYRKLEGAPGKDKPALNPEEALSPEQALRAVTLDAAWHCHLDHQVGSLEAGKQADLVILEHDPLTETAVPLRDIKVIATWLSGAPVRIER